MRPAWERRLPGGLRATYRSPLPSRESVLRVSVPVVVCGKASTGFHSMPWLRAMQRKGDRQNTVRHAEE